MALRHVVASVIGVMLSVLFADVSPDPGDLSTPSPCVAFGSESPGSCGLAVSEAMAPRAAHFTRVAQCLHDGWSDMAIVAPAKGLVLAPGTPLQIHLTFPGCLAMRGVWVSLKVEYRGKPTPERSHGAYLYAV